MVMYIARVSRHIHLKRIFAVFFLFQVKDPVVCPNQHVFCSTCMAQWLKSNQICPTCRVPVNDKQPCKRLIGKFIKCLNKVNASYSHK